jgi:mannosyltransferase OCH1-like enzyme
MMQRTALLKKIALVTFVAAFVYMVKSVTNMNSKMNSLDQPKRQVPLEYKTENYVPPPDMKIPRIVHVTWKDNVLPAGTVQWVKLWAKTNPDWQVWFWTDADARQLVKKKFRNYLPLYDRYPAPIYKADAMRYFILFEYGGVYADLDVEPLRSLNPLRDQTPCLLSQEPDEHAKLLNDVFSNDQKMLACNAFMACRTGHPFFLSVLKNLEANHNLSERFHHVPGRTIISTGPGMLTKMYTIYMNRSRKHLAQFPDDNVWLAPPDYFTPIFDPIKLQMIKFKCVRQFHLMSRLKRQVCLKLKSREFLNIPGEIAYTSHNWFHSWLSGEEGKEGRSAGFTNLTLQQILPGIKEARYLVDLQPDANVSGSRFCIPLISGKC